MFLMCSNARAAENAVGGTSVGSGAGNQKLESPSAAANAQIPILDTRSGFMKPQAYPRGGNDQTETGSK